MPSSKNIEDIRSLADFLDTKFRGPFGFRFGWDGIIGLIPGLGDLITNLLAAYIILRAGWMGYPLPVLLRMLVNFLIDNIVDAIPFLGAIFDFFFKANTRNLRLMERYELAPDSTRRRSLAYLIVLTAGIILFTGALIALSVGAALWILNWILVNLS